ncbi:MAG: hypothetical protein RL069_2315 [Planctomycetota bacterium]|jgi:hypothetical protein
MYVTTVPVVIIEIKTDTRDLSLKMRNEGQSLPIGDPILLSILGNRVEGLRSQGAYSICIDGSLRTVIGLE